MCIRDRGAAGAQGAAGSATLSNNADNRVITGGSGTNLNGEANLTYDGTTLKIGGDSGVTGTWGLEVYNTDTSNNLGKAVFAGNQGAEIKLQDTVSGETVRIAANGQASFYSEKAGDPMVFYTKPSGGSNTSRLYIDSDGKIGVNLSNPGDYNSAANNLVVHSSPSVNDAGITIRSNYAGSGGLYFADGTGTSSDKGYIVYGQSNDTMYLGVNRGSKLQINTNGAFGLAGSNYGTAGQVLTSQGSGSAVQWASVSAFDGALDGMIFGGTETTYTSGGTTYKVHTFLSTGFLRVTATTTMDILIVAGGGGSPQAEGSWGSSGGGGAGGCVEGSSCLLYKSPSPRDATRYRMPSSD